MKRQIPTQMFGGRLLHWLRSINNFVQSTVFSVVILAGHVLAVPIAAAYEGPLQVKNQFLPFVPLNLPYLESAEVRSQISLGISHASIYAVNASSAWVLLADCELTEVDLHVKKAFDTDGELGIQLPLVRAEAGFLDAPLAEFHDAFDLPNYGRSARPRNAFLYEIAHAHTVIVSGEDGRSGLGDVRLTAKKVISHAGPIISVSANIELPTGDARLGYGNGDTDLGAALLVNADIGSSIRSYTNAGFVYPGKLKARQTIGLRTAYFVGAGLEYGANSRYELLLQAMAQSSPYPKTGIYRLDGIGVLLSMGGRIHLSSGAVEIALSEDPTTSGTPDFIVHMNYTFTY